jgi:DNA-binding winged helix-turn-helix (wHTH) protein
MAVLRRVEDGQRCNLRHDHLIGRSPRCDLQISDDQISGHHAAIRWTGDAWQVKDLGSRYGTSVNGVALEPGTAASLEQGASLSFGRASCHWVLDDTSPPAVMAIPASGGSPLLLDGDMIALPSEASPEVTILRGQCGEWQIESADTLTQLAEGDTFLAGGILWRFSCPAIVAPTSELETRPSLRDVGLRFTVSNDRVEIGLQCEDRIFRMGSPRYARFLLNLARRRLSDEAEGRLPSMCGWINEEDLLESSPRMQMNVQIYQARRHFCSLGLDDATSIVERRVKTKQIRIGMVDLIVLPVEQEGEHIEPPPKDPPLILDEHDRRFRGVEMQPLLAGEFALLTFLGAHANTWYSTEQLSSHVYRRDDSAGRQLVWKYASTLRKKLSGTASGLIAVCRRRGYSCQSTVLVVNENRQGNRVAGPSE